MSVQTHQSDPRILNRRTLECDHRRLAAILKPGMKVLDVGCGTGAITAGIARAVSPEGRVVGIDRDADLLAEAHRLCDGLLNIRFEQTDVMEMQFRGEFDVVTTARTLQWLAHPLEALKNMRGAAVSGGFVIALDYAHTRNRWEPEPPEAFRDFYRAFLDWRSANGWDNDIADKLDHLFRQIGLEQVEVFDESEVSIRGDARFADAAKVWTHVIETLGPKIVESGFLAESRRASAVHDMAEWCRTHLERQTLAMRATRGVAPSS